MITFKNKALNVSSLLDFGFEKAGDVYVFSDNIVDNQLKLIVTVYENGTLDTRVVDTAFEEEYTLHLVESAFGSFVGQVREEYTNILKRIEENCYDSSYLEYSQKAEILEGVWEKYGIKAECPFEEDEETVVLRRQDNQKWFAIIMTVKENRLGLPSDKLVHVMNVKIDPRELNLIVDNNRYFRAYHMNKKMWTSLILDGRLPLKEILNRIDDSYNLTQKK